MPYLLITFQKGGYLGMKKWGMINKIKKELEAGKSISEISRELGIDRKTVRKYRDMTHEDIAKKMNQNKKRSKKVDKFKDYINKRIKEYEAEIGKKKVWSPHLTYLVYLVDLVYLVYLVCLAHMREA